MYCKKCGSRIEEDGVFCIDCGTPVTAKEATTNLYRTERSDARSPRTVSRESIRNQTASTAASGRLANDRTDMAERNYQVEPSRNDRNLYHQQSQEMVSTKSESQKTMTCPACGGLVSKNAYTCPHCGDDLEEVRSYYDRELYRDLFSSERNKNIRRFILRSLVFIVPLILCICEGWPIGDCLIVPILALFIFIFVSRFFRHFDENYVTVVTEYGGDSYTTGAGGFGAIVGLILSLASIFGLYAIAEDIWGPSSFYANFVVWAYALILIVYPMSTCMFSILDNHALYKVATFTNNEDDFGNFAEGTFAKQAKREKIRRIVLGITLGCLVIGGLIALPFKSKYIQREEQWQQEHNSSTSQVIVDSNSDSDHNY